MKINSVRIPNINKKKIIESLGKNKRLNDRGLLDYRDINIELGISKNAEGSARVKIGKTEVIAGVKLSTQEPYSDHEDEGTMSVFMEFSPLCGERYESGPPRVDSIEIARIVDRGIRESGFIDWKELCIKKNEKVWSIMIDIYCINDDGNILDVSSRAAIAALQSAYFPRYDEKEEKVKFGEFTKNKLPLTKNIPFQITFYNIKENLLLDADREEEDISDGRFTITLSQPKNEKIINSLQKGGTSAFSSQEINLMIENSEKIYDTHFSKIDNQIKKLIKTKN